MRLTIALGFVLALLTASGASARSDSDSDSDRRHRVKQVEVMNLPELDAGPSQAREGA